MGISKNKIFQYKNPAAGCNVAYFVKEKIIK